MLRQLKIRQYLAAMATRGFAARRVLAGTGLQEKDLGDPAYVPDLEQYHGVVANMIALSGDKGIGLEIGSYAHRSIQHEPEEIPSISRCYRHTRTFARPMAVILTRDLLRGASGREVH